MRLDPASFYDRVLLFYPQFYDPDEIRFLERTLPRGGTFLDAGAHIGFYALLASRLVGATGQVLAIEAERVNYDRLCANLTLNDAPNVAAVHAGVAEREAVLPIAVNTRGNRAESSFLFGDGQKELVACHPLLNMLREYSISRIDSLKMDIEGYEYRVLEAFLRDARPELRPRSVIVEFQPWMVERAGGDVIALLLRHGYRVHGQHLLNYILVLE